MSSTATDISGGTDGAAQFVEPFTSLFIDLAQIGRRADGSHQRIAWTAEDGLARAWFKAQASRIGLRCDTDGNGNLWAWWGTPGRHAIVTGSHLDTVFGGGAFDGALGVVAGFVALEHLVRLNPARHKPIAVVAFVDEEGARFGVPTFGSRLMTGQLDPNTIRQRKDASGTTVEDALASMAIDWEGVGRDELLTGYIEAFVEVHIEQGTDLVKADKPIGLADSVWPHGRWKLRLEGESNHAGTARIPERRDPMVVAATAVLAARQIASDAGVFATVGKIATEPNSTNSVAESVDLWLDLRALNDAELDRALADWLTGVRAAAATNSVEIELTQESRTSGVKFDAGLREAIDDCFSNAPLPVLSTAAGHDAAVLAANLATAMIFVRNLTGVSHARNESASMDDCAISVWLLTKLLERLAFGSGTVDAYEPVPDGTQ